MVTRIMEKSRSSPLSFLFPWLSPRVLKFALIDNGIEVQLWRNNRLLSNWHPSQLRHVLPEPLTKWIDDNHIHEGPQPYPLIKQFWHYLLPITSKKLVIDRFKILSNTKNVLCRSLEQPMCLIGLLLYKLTCLDVKRMIVKWRRDHFIHAVLPPSEP